MKLGSDIRKKMFAGKQIELELKDKNKVEKASLKNIFA